MSFLDGVDCVGRLFLIVFGADFDFLPEHARAAVDFIEGEVNAFVGGGAEGGGGAGHGAVVADTDDVGEGGASAAAAALCRRCRCHHRSRAWRGKSAGTRTRCAWL
jgi:hypothetical protein